MKFGKQLQAEQAPGWSGYYVDYKGLKKIINSLAKGRPADAALLAAGVRPSESAQQPEQPQLIPTSNGDINGNTQKTSLQAHKAAFFFKLERELEKINAFYFQREASLKVRLRTLIDKRKLLQSTLHNSLSKESSSYEALYEGFRNFERDLSRLQAYVELNATAFRKICKKFDKACRREADRKDNSEEGPRDGQLYLARQVEVQPVFNREFIAELSDVASANLLSLDNLLSAEGKRRVESFADGVNMGRPSWRGDSDSANAAEALEDLEQALVNAVKADDRQSADELVKVLSSPAYSQQNTGMHLTAARILWRAALQKTSVSIVNNGSSEVAQAVEQKASEPLIPLDVLDFAFVDDINGRTCLHEAANNGRIDLTAVSLERGVAHDKADVYGRQALHYAAMKGHAEVTRILVKAGASPYVLDLDGYSPLLYSVINGHKDVMQTFIEQGVTFEQGPPAGQLNPLSLACQHGHAEIVKLLLGRGAQIVPNSAGYFPQHLAAREGHSAVLTLLGQALSSDKGSIDVPDKYSQATPLCHAASEGHAECVKVLVQAGSNVAAKDEFRKTPIHYAAWQGHIDCVNLLLQAGATPESTISPETFPHRSPGDAATGSMSSTEVEPMDLDADMIPSLSLPPPIIPFRIYGHNYLDKKSLVQVTLGHPNTSREPSIPVRLFEQTSYGQHSALKLVMTSKPDSLSIPHSVILPLADEREVFSFDVEKFQHFSLEFDLYPTFGSKVIGKAVALPSLFADLKGHGSYTIPLLDSHLKVIGEIPFEVNVVKPFERTQLQLGGQFETYWKTTTTVSGSSDPVSGAAAPQGGAGPSVVTASSLSGDHVRIVVQVTNDGVPVAYPLWKLPVETFDVFVGEVTCRQFLDLAQKSDRILEASAVQNKDDAAAWYTAISNSLVTLEDVLRILPMSMGVNIEVRYPTRCDYRRLQLRNVHEVNEYVDSVLSIVYEAVQRSSSAKQHRRIVFSSFNPVVCTTLNWKQPNFSVFFASYCGLSRSSPEGKMVPANRVEDDKRCTSIREAVKFAKANNLLGVMLDATILTQVPSLVASAKEHSILVCTFGTTNRVPTADAHMTSGVLSYATSQFLQRTETS